MVIRPEYIGRGDWHRYQELGGVGPETGAEEQRGSGGIYIESHSIQPYTIALSVSSTSEVAQEWIPD